MPRRGASAYAGAIVCGAHREIAHDYLRDGSHAGRGQNALRSKLDQLAVAPHASLLPNGLRCALVDDADVVMLDDAQAPLVLAVEADQSRERLMYEQAIELARTLVPDADFTLAEEGVRLAPPAAQRLESLVAPLGGIWSARQRREELIGAAVEALHCVERDVDYRVEGGRVLFPPPPDGAEPAPEEAEFRKLVEVKEGCRLSARREVVARLSLPRFFGRYQALAGACADASGLEGEFWALYSLKTARAGLRPEPVGAAPRVFVTATAKRAAVVDAVRASASAGRAVLVALRTPAEAQRVHGELTRAGVEAPITLFPVLDAAALAGAPKPLTLLIAELPDAHRHVARVYRASGASACEMLLSLEDEAVGPRLPLSGAARLAARDSGELPAGVARWVVAAAQRATERACRSLRSEIAARERSLDDLLAFSGQRE